jgi:hypothetical protein
VVDEAHDHTPAPKSPISVLLVETGCVFKTLWLLIRGRITQPRESVGRSIVFADGTRSVVYRETTTMRARHHDNLILIVVRFRLRIIGASRVAHWLFRVESLLNTLLFAAHPGFETKLWLTDRRTGYYRGIYEWRGHPEADEYAETLRVVLRPWVERGSFAYQVIEAVSRADYLNGVQTEPSQRTDEDWWRIGVASAPASAADGAR